MLKRIKGNLLEMAENGYFDVIVHGCNCQNVMGKGIAKDIRDRWPIVWLADCKATEQWRKPVSKLGNFSHATVLGNPDSVIKHVFIVVNAYTQLNYGKGKDYFEYESFYLILRKLASLDPKNIVRFGFPHIGMTNAGGDPERIIPMLEEFAIEHDVTLVEHKK